MMIAENYAPCLYGWPRATACRLQHSSVALISHKKGKDERKKQQKTINLYTDSLNIAHAASPPSVADGAIFYSWHPLTRGRLAAHSDTLARVMCGLGEGLVEPPTEQHHMHKFTLSDGRASPLLPFYLLLTSTPAELEMVALACCAPL